jgi:hypothetical protein
MNDKIPWPDSEQELLDYIRSVMDVKRMTPEEAFEAGKRAAEGDTSGMDGYNKVADAMWKVAAAAFYYVAKQLGATGFQAGWASMQLFRELRGYKCPFAIIKAEDILYPQYDIEQNIQECIESFLPWAADEARKRLEELKNEDRIHPDVLKRWKYLAELPGLKDVENP